MIQDFTVDQTVVRNAEYSLAQSTSTLRTVFLTYDTVQNIFEQAILSAESLTITEKDFNSNSKFKLDMRTLQRIFPDIIMEKGMNHKVLLKVNGMNSKIDLAKNLEKGYVTLSNILYKVEVYLDNFNAKLCEAQIQLKASFKPMVLFPNSNSVSVNLFGFSISAKTKEAKSFMDINHIFNSEGIAHAFESAVDNDVFPFNNPIAFGSGFPVSGDFRVAHWLTLVSLKEQGLEILVSSY